MSWNSSTVYQAYIHAKIYCIVVLYIYINIFIICMNQNIGILFSYLELNSYDVLFTVSRPDNSSAKSHLHRPERDVPGCHGVRHLEQDH